MDSFDKTLANSPKAVTKFGPYTVLAPLGAGGMGVVYRARDERLDREVAIKVIKPGLLTSEAARRRFRTEALALAKLNHPSIATVHDVGVHEGADYLVMEYVRGETLRDVLESGSLQTTEILSLASEIASALEEAHAQGIVHRDLKPANIVVTPKGHAKILDFGLAKLLDTGVDTDVTHPSNEPQTVGIVGTALYMSPEQAQGKSIDARTDIWSLGVILYEALAGRTPFRGESAPAILRAVVHDTPEPLQRVRGGVPPEAEAIVSRALQKNVASRYPSAADMSRDLASAVARLSLPAGTPAVARANRSLYAVAAAAVVLAAIAAMFFYRRESRREWAKETAIPTIRHLLSEDRSLAAFQLLNEARRVLPEDTQLQQIEKENVSMVSITSSPSGVPIEIQDYVGPEKPWLVLGATPLKNVRLPNGYFRWRASNVTFARTLQQRMTFEIPPQDDLRARMVRVHGGQWANMIDFIGWLGPYQLPSYDIDQFEVTNREYQEFVDRGGYSKPEYWQSKFVLDGRELPRDEAMMLFRDRTGRAGPSTWEGGHYPDGQADYPVSGVSWYEASAYAKYANKSLPVLAQWFMAAPPDVAPLTVRESNISTNALAPAGAFKGVGPYGTYDMIGNVREWIENSTGHNDRFILGGAWNSQSYLSVSPEALPAFDRSPTNGFRCVRNLAAMPQSAAARLETMQRDFTKFKPASDEVFNVYRSMYAYDNVPLDAKTEGVVQDSSDWREEKITFNAAYGNERITAYFFVPKKVRPPFQTVVFFPSARVLYLQDSRTLGDIKFFDYVVQSGRAVLYPVYKGTYERQEKLVLPGTQRGVELVIKEFKDVARSIDYLRSRPDVNASRIAYLGVSMGAANGVIFTTLLQEQLKAIVFLDGGYFLSTRAAGLDQADFAPRLKKPVLMVNGRYDFTFALDKAQDPMFRMLGTPDADKRHVVLNSPHDVTARRSDLVREVLAWLDKYLGRIN